MLSLPVIEHICNRVNEAGLGGVEVDGGKALGQFIAELIESAPGAALNAAAPDLLTELKALRDRFHKAVIAAGTGPEFAAGSTPGADAAIARAEGRAP